MAGIECVLTSGLHDLVELGLDVELRVISLHTLQLDGHLLPGADISAYKYAQSHGNTKTKTTTVK